MKILVIGSGGREHSLCWAIAASPLCDALFCAPGNGGIEEVATCLPIDVLDFDGIVACVRERGIDFVVVGPEVPLVEGLVDRLEVEGIKSFGPNAAAAQLEGSKAFAKAICVANDIPAAAHARFTNPDAAKHYIREQGAPIVVKADGLAAGKGVIVADTVDDALRAVDHMFTGGFGAAGEEVVIEEFLAGEEVSFFALSDGEHVLPLPSAQDHKRVGDGETGPNTGGMGAYSPVPVVTDELAQTVFDRIMAATIRAMKARGTPYKGALYAGVMVTADGPKMFEFNARFGDPECQIQMMRLKSDIVPALLACHDGGLDQVDLQWHDDVALTVVMAAEGYPGAYEKGTVIGNLEEAAALDNVEIFHAGTEREINGSGVIRAVGGRVLNVTARAPSVALARERAYEAVDLIDWPEGFCRRDIGWRALEREAAEA